MEYNINYTHILKSNESLSLMYRIIPYQEILTYCSSGPVSKLAEMEGAVKELGGFSSESHSQP